MATELTGQRDGRGLRVALAASRFNEELTQRLLRGALDACAEAQVAEGDLTVAWVPGAFELPTLAAALARSGRYDLVVCLGVVLQGETAHFDHIAQQAAAGIAAVGRESGVPVMFGVLTAYTEEQALSRSGGAHGNRGYDVTMAGFETVDVLRQVRAGAAEAPERWAE